MQIVACIFVGDIGNPQYLFKSYLSKWQFNANHLNTRLPLAVNAARQPQAPELIVMDFPFTKRPDLFFKIDDIFFNYGVLQFCSEALHMFLLFCDIKMPLRLQLKRRYFKVY